MLPLLETFLKLEGAKKRRSSASTLGAYFVGYLIQWQIEHSKLEGIEELDDFRGCGILKTIGRSGADYYYAVYPDRVEVYENTYEHDLVRILVEMI